MIQRIQSVYLLLGAIALVGLLFFDSLWQSTAAATYGWFIPAVVGLGVVTAGVGLVAIFMYNNRERQRRVVVGVQLGTVLMLAALYGGLFLTNGLNVRTAGGALDVNKIVMLVLPVVAYAFFYLARRGIESDIELLKSVDRLR